MRHSLRYYTIVDALIRRRGSRLPATAQEDVSMLAELHVEDDIGEERRFNSRLALMTDPEIARYVHSAVAMVLAELERSGLRIDDPDRFRARWCEAYTTRYQAVREQIAPTLPYRLVVDRFPGQLDPAGITIVARPLGSWGLQFPVGTVRHAPVTTLTYVDWVLERSEEVTTYTLPSGQVGHSRCSKRLTQGGTWEEGALFELDSVEPPLPREERITP
jgi:hypothetical protein